MFSPLGRSFVIFFYFSLMGINVPNLRSQTPIWQWALTAEENFDTKGWAIATDNKKNIFVVGHFDSITLINQGNSDVFLVKYDKNGQLIWAKNFGGTGNDRGESVASDLAGNIYLTGNYSSPNINLDSFTLLNNGNYDVFAACYDSVGNVLWAQSIGGTGDEKVTTVSVNNSNQIIIGGYFDSDSIFLSDSIFINKGSYDAFIVKFDTSGNIQWAEVLGGNKTDVIYSISADLFGNFFAAGYFDSPSLDFSIVNLLNNSGSDDIFISQFNSSGEAIWAKRLGGLGSDRAFSSFSDSTGNLIICGIYNSSTLSFGTSSLGNNGGFDVFVAEYNNFGNFQWAKAAGGLENDFAIDVCSVSNDEIITTGYFYSPSISFGSILLQNDNIETADLFIANLSLVDNLPDNSVSEEFKIFPNPSNGLLHMQVSDSIFNNELAELILFNFLGQEIFHTKILTSPINLSNIPAGIYYFQIKSENTKEAGKLILH